MTISTPSPVTLYTTPPAETGYSILLLAANVVPHMEVLVCWHILFLPEFQRQGQWRHCANCLTACEHDSRMCYARASRSDPYFVTPVLTGIQYGLRASSRVAGAS